MSLDIEQLKELVIIPTLNALDLQSEIAVNLLLGTALVESNAAFLAQKPKPIAMGLWMCEQPTYADIRERLITGHRDLYTKLLKFLNIVSLPIEHDFLAGNLYAACAMARLKYWLLPNPLPTDSSPESLAEYWGKYYNTKNLDTDKERFVRLYKQYVK